MKFTGSEEQQMISSPEAALIYGTDGAAATVKFGHVHEAELNNQASLLADSCERWAMPLMIEALVNGKNLNSTDPRCVKPAAPAAQEIGADIMKTCYTGRPKSFGEVVEGCPAPAVLPLAGISGSMRMSGQWLRPWSVWCMRAGVSIRR